MAKLSTEIEALFSTWNREVDHTLRNLIQPHEDHPIANLDDALAYALGLDDAEAARGKRIRPLLALLVCHSLGAPHRRALPFAAAIELMHNFCLVHDDLEDGDEFRRGRPSVWKHYGIPHAVNIGDYLFTKIFAALLLSHGHVDDGTIVRFFALMASTLDHTHRGQALDINARTGRISIDDYMKLVSEKTGYYLAAPLVAGAIAAEATQAVEETLNTFGQFIGPLFQIQDDLIDLTNDKGREARGSDIREGKRSFMVAFVCENAPPEVTDELIAILDTPRDRTTDAQVARAMQIFEETGALTQARSIMQQLRREALDALVPLPNPLKTHLHDITEYLVHRTA